MSVSNNSDQAEIRSLHHRHATWLLQTLTRRYGDQNAEDLCQETWLRVVRTGSKHLRHPKAFLLSVASHLAVDSLRSLKRAQQGSAFQGVCTGGHAQPATQIEQIVLRKVVLGLPQPLRDVFVLSRFGGLTNVQIAERLGIRPKTVEWRMTKALAHCAAQLRA